MTRISEIHGIGIPADEYADRGAMVTATGYVPYLSLTQGEMRLWLAAQRAKILAQWYGSDAPQYAQAATMIENALYRGIHGQPPYLGTYHNSLRDLVRAIARASHETRPAANGVILGRQTMVRGLHIGNPIIPTEDRRKACLAAAEKLSGIKRMQAISACNSAFSIETILNNGLENCGQYLAYGFLPKNNNLPQIANQKIYNQELAQADISRVGKFNIDLCQQWLNVGMMRRNADTAKVGPLDWIATNANLTMLPQAGADEVAALLRQSQSKWTGQSSSAVGAKLAAIVKKYQQPKIGDPVTVTIAIVTAITTLIGTVSEFAKQLKREQDDAFAQVNGFGARPFGPEEGDWDGDGIPDSQDGTPGGTTNFTVPLLFGVAALLLMADGN